MAVESFDVRPARTAAAPRSACADVDPAAPTARIHDRSRTDDAGAPAWARRVTAALRRRARGHDRPRRRLARLPAARRRADPPHARPLAGRRARRAAASSPRSRPRRTRSARSSPARSAPSRDVEVDVDVYRRARRRRLPALLGRADVDGPRGARRGDPRGARTRSRRPARELIAAANEAGGRDNITVVLFRLEEVGPAPRAADEPGDDASDARRRARRDGVAPRPRQRRTRPDHASADAGAPSTAARGSRCRGRAGRADAEPPPARRAAAGAAPRRRRAAIPAVVASSSWRSSLGGLWIAIARRLLRRHRPTHGARHDLPRPARTSCRSGIELYERDYALGRAGSSTVPARAARDVHRPQAALARTTPRTS